MDEALITRQARPDEVAPLSRVLAAAFAEDPVWGCQQRFFALELAQVVPIGIAWTVGGACLALPPGGWRMPRTAQVRHAAGFTRVLGRRLPRATALITRLESHHLREPHWNLPPRGRAWGGR